MKFDTEDDEIAATVAAVQRLIDAGDDVHHLAATFGVHVDDFRRFVAGEASLTATVREKMRDHARGKRCRST